MKTRVAVRNLRLCTKDCLCLYVCPTGAADTEDSIIDVNKCIGCGVCADACPGAAISMVPLEYPPQQKKKETVIEHAVVLAKNKTKEETIAMQMAESAGSDAAYRLFRAVEKAVRLVHEDIAREAGYMLPQSGNTHALLKEWVNNPPSAEFPVSCAEELLKSIPDNDKKTKKYKCLVCNAEFEVEEGEEVICPICKAKGDQLVEIE